MAQLPQRFGLPVLYVTHQIDEVLRLADQTVVMSDGKVVASGATLELLSDLALHPFVGRFEAGSVLAGRIEQHLAEWQLTQVSVAGQRITVAQLEAATGAAVRLRIRARDIAVQREIQPSSASNQLTGTVLQVLDRDGPYCAIEIALRDRARRGGGRELQGGGGRRALRGIASRCRRAIGSTLTRRESDPFAGRSTPCRRLS